MTKQFPKKIKETDGTDLFFKSFYKNVRKLRLILERNAGEIGNTVDLCAFAEDSESMNITKETRKKLVLTETYLERIKINIENSIKETKRILDLYDGFGVAEVYEADTESILPRENPLT